MQAFAQRIVKHRAFEYFIIAVILVSAVLIGMEASPGLFAEYQGLLLMGVIFYIYAVAGRQLFHTHDPQHGGNLGLSLLTLFRIVTL